MSDTVEKDLYILVGKYEATCKQIFDRLGTIDESLEEGNKAFEELRGLSAGLETRMQLVEQKDSLGGITQREKVGLLTAVVMAIYGLIKIGAKFFGVELP